MFVINQHSTTSVPTNQDCPISLVAGKEDALYSLVRLGEERCHVTLPIALEHYLYAALLRFYQPIDDGVSLEKTRVTELYSRALETSQVVERVHILNTMGQLALVLSGLFPQLAYRRDVSVQFYKDMACGGYSYIDTMVHAHPQMLSLRQIAPPALLLIEHFDLLGCVITAFCTPCKSSGHALAQRTGRLRTSAAFTTRTP
jgi:hypothetical protein